MCSKAAIVYCKRRRGLTHCRLAPELSLLLSNLRRNCGDYASYSPHLFPKSIRIRRTAIRLETTMTIRDEENRKRRDIRKLIARLCHRDEGKRISAEEELVATSSESIPLLIEELERTLRNRKRLPLT